MYIVPICISGDRVDAIGGSFRDDPSLGRSKKREKSCEVAEAHLEKLKVDLNEVLDLFLGVMNSGKCDALITFYTNSSYCIRPKLCLVVQVLVFRCITG